MLSPLARNGADDAAEGARTARHWLVRVAPYGSVLLGASMIMLIWFGTLYFNGAGNIPTADAAIAGLLTLWVAGVTHLLVRYQRLRRSTAPRPAHAEPASVTFDKEIYAELAHAVGLDDIRTVTRDFLSDTARRLELLRRAAASGDRAAVKAEAHTAKGAAGVLGFFRFSDLAEALERDIASLDGAGLKQRLDRIEAEFAAIMLIANTRLLATGTAEN